MYDFKDTKGQKQSPIEQYFNRTKHNNELSINQVSDYIGNVPTGVYAREPIAYAFKKVAMELGHKEPVRFNQLSFEPMRVPFDTNYIYDETLPSTMEEVRQEGVDRRYTGRFEIPMYGKVALGNRIEVGQDITEEGADEIIAIGTKPWVNVLQPSYVNKNYASTILVGDIPKEPQTVTNLDIPLELQQTAMGAGFEVRNAPLTLGEKYTIAFEYQPTQGGINDIHSYGLGYEGTNVYIDDELIAEFGYLPASKWAVGGGKHTYYMHFTKANDGNVFSWQFNYKTYTQPTKVWITNLKIYEGHVHPFREDLELLPIEGTAWQTRTRTEIIPYVRETVEKPELLPSQSRIERKGVNGHRTYQWTVEVVNGIETGNKTPEEQIEHVAPTDEIYWRGTKVPTTIPSIVDYGAVGDNQTDNFENIKNAVLEAIDEPFELVIPQGDFYLKGGQNQRIEAFPNTLKGLELIGEGGTLYPENNRTISKHEHWVMQLAFSEINSGATIQGVKVNGHRNNINDLFAINPDPRQGYPNSTPPGTKVPASEIPLQRGFILTGAKEVEHHYNRYEQMYGGYVLTLRDWNQLHSSNNEYIGVGGNNWTESFGMAIHLGGAEGDSYALIENDKATGLISPTDPSKMSWIGFVLENGSIQSSDSSNWIIDDNSVIDIIDSDFLDFETGYHVESQAGNVYLNIWGGHARVKNYLIYSGINGEVKVRVYNQTIDFIPQKRYDSHIQGLLYSENEEVKNNSGVHTIEFINCTLNYPTANNKDGSKFNPALSYADSCRPILKNCTLNNVRDKLVINASATLIDCEINLSQDNYNTTENLIRGTMNKPEQSVVFTRTNINSYGSWKTATPASEPEKVRATGFVPPEFEEPIPPAEMEDIRIETETENIVNYQTETNDNPDLDEGTTQVVREGVNGYDTVTYRVTYEGGIEVSREEISRVTTPPVNEIVEVGTKQVVTELIDILTPSNVVLSGSTDLETNGVRALSQIISNLSLVELRQWATPFGGVNVSAKDLELDSDYTIAFKYEVKERVSTIRSTGNGMFWRHKAYIDGNLVSERADADVTSDKWPVTAGNHTFVYQFNTGASGNKDLEIWRILFNENVEGVTSNHDSVLWLRDVAIYEGHVNPFI